MHTVWKGALSLGLLNIGIKLYSAVEENDIKFLSLHKECLTPIKYKKFAPDCADEEVDDKDIVKAYEYAPINTLLWMKKLAALQKLTNHDLFVLYLLFKITKLILFSMTALIL